MSDRPARYNAGSEDSLEDEDHDRLCNCRGMVLS